MPLCIPTSISFYITCFSIPNCIFGSEMPPVPLLTSEKEIVDELVSNLSSVSGACLSKYDTTVKSLSLSLHSKKMLACKHEKYSA